MLLAFHGCSSLFDLNYLLVFDAKRDYNFLIFDELDYLLVVAAHNAPAVIMGQ
jgi:hypothetical protein